VYPELLNSIHDPRHQKVAFLKEFTLLNENADNVKFSKRNKSTKLIPEVAAILVDLTFSLILNFEDDLPIFWPRLQYG
jgi:hypothetical protein